MKQDRSLTRSFVLGLLLVMSVVMALVLGPSDAGAFDSPYCGHGEIQYSGAHVIYYQGYTTAGTHYHTYLHTGFSEANHYAKTVCGGIGTRASE